MIALRPHRLWIALFALALAIIIGSGPALDYAREKAARDLANIKTACAKIEQNLQQLRDNVTAARKLNGQIDRAQAERVLAPVDRLKIAERLEQEANAAKLSHFTYTLAPEEHTAINIGGETQDLAASAVSLTADARDDVVAYNFVERARQLLPGQARLRQLTVTRTPTPLATSSNIHIEVTIDWVSNGAVQTLASGP